MKLSDHIKDEIKLYLCHRNNRKGTKTEKEKEEGETDYKKKTGNRKRSQRNQQKS